MGSFREPIKAYPITEWDMQSIKAVSVFASVTGIAAGFLLGLAGVGLMEAKGVLVSNSRDFIPLLGTLPLILLLLAASIYYATEGNRIMRRIKKNTVFNDDAP